MANQINITLEFAGGPLEGLTRLQQIPADWSVIRYEHLPRLSADTRHIYRGHRQLTDQTVQLQYAGAERTESAT